MCGGARAEEGGGEPGEGHRHGPVRLQGELGGVRPPPVCSTVLFFSPGRRWIQATFVLKPPHPPEATGGSRGVEDAEEVELLGLEMFSGPLEYEVSSGCLGGGDCGVLIPVGPRRSATCRFAGNR